MSRTILLLWGAPAGGKSSIAREIVALYRNRTGRSYGQTTQPTWICWLQLHLR